MRERRFVWYLLAIFVVLFFMMVSSLVYNSFSLHRKLETVKNEVSIPTSEQNVFITRIRFLCFGIQNSHNIILTYVAQNNKDLVESELLSLKDLTTLRLKELDRLQSAVEKSIAKDTVQKLFLQDLETKITALDLKQAEFVEAIESAKKGMEMEDMSPQLNKEWNELHKQVIETESVFLLHNQKEVEETRELVNIIEQQSREMMYLSLGSFLVLVLVLVLVYKKSAIKPGKK